MQNLKMLPANWDNYDTTFVEKCIAEFDGIDPQGMVFRYASEGAETLHVHFHWRHAIMEHVNQVLEGIRVYLIDTHGQNADYESYLRSQYGGDSRKVRYFLNERQRFVGGNRQKTPS